MGDKSLANLSEYVEWSLDFAFERLGAGLFIVIYFLHLFIYYLLKTFIYLFSLLFCFAFLFVFSFLCNNDWPALISHL